MIEIAAQNGRQPNETLARFMLIAALKDMADRHPDVKLPEVARKMGVDKSTLGRWFAGAKNNLRPMDVQSLCAAYGYSADHGTTRQLIALAEAAKQRGFVQKHDWFALYQFKIFLRLERDSRTVRTYQSVLLPGLLQTAAYTEAVVRSMLPGVTASGIADRVRLRMDRQAALRRPHAPVELHAIIDEGVLRRRLPDAESWRAQLEHLSAASQWDNVTIQVMLESAGPHEGVTGSFVLFSFDGAETVPGLGPVAYQEITDRAIYADEAGATAVYEQRFRRLSERAADAKTSSDMIARAIAAAAASEPTGGA